jgi:hypothetical protein
VIDVAIGTCQTPKRRIGVKVLGYVLMYGHLQVQIMGVAQGADHHIRADAATPINVTHRIAQPLIGAIILRCYADLILRGVDQPRGPLRGWGGIFWACPLAGVPWRGKDNVNNVRQFGMNHQSVMR